jgi:hypothetical protein
MEEVVDKHITIFKVLYSTYYEKAKEYMNMVKMKWKT